MPSRTSSVADRSITAIPAARSPWASMSSSGAPTANAAVSSAMPHVRDRGLDTITAATP